MESGDKSVKIRDFILYNIPQHPHDIVTFTASMHNMSRQAVLRHIDGLIADNMIIATGAGRARAYKLINETEIITKNFTEVLEIRPGMEEHVFWNEKFVPRLKDINSNVLEVCYHGFTEMCNNVFSHAEAKYLVIGLDRDTKNITITVGDDGIGIFEKIKQAEKLVDPREAILELTKGKFTTSPSDHSGQGIFFTSRMFDEFMILSGKLSFIRSIETSGDEDWLFQQDKEKKDEIKGTYITIKISTESTTIVKVILNKYNGEDYSFAKTHVPLKLALIGDQNLISRSQAKRVLSRFDKFEEVLLDFKDIKQIGQAFSDEVFRVFKFNHPNIKVFYIHANEDVEQMIKRAERSYTSEEPSKEPNTELESP
ncbi:MAG TPA: DUF4325 domain-containing protein [Phycisphaerae bacterium]|nr:DUF4325 domain-containing protein [Phycisphaerae bacterium]